MTVDETRTLVEPLPRVVIPRFRLQATAGPDKGKAFVTGVEPTVIGTHESAEVRLTDDAVSRFHAELTREGSQLTVRDLGSRNGTRLDGVRVRDAILAVGSRLVIGETTLVLEGETGATEAELSGKGAFGRLVGKSVPMRRTMALLERAAGADATVLLLGETGTGKEAAAEALHAASARRDKPFVVVDCGALPPTLLESELFGHRRGAFTGATADRVGALEASDGGTLFFDEIGEVPLDLQPKLLRAIEAREFRRLGDTRSQSFDARIVAATHRDLRVEVNEKRFRADLFYRLAVVSVTLPALRERRGDLPLLVDTLAERLGASTAQRQALAADKVFQADLAAHAFPGNVRELRNLVERALVMGTAEDLVAEPRDLPPDDQTLASLPLKTARAHATARFERSYLTALLAAHQDNVAAAARAAEVDRMHFYRLLWRHGLR